MSECDSIRVPRRVRARSEILREVFGPDPRVLGETPMHYDLDAALLDMMLKANPPEEHLQDYSGYRSRTQIARAFVQQPGGIGSAAGFWF
jgi:hypothetical protein